MNSNGVIAQADKLGFLALFPLLLLLVSVLGYALQGNPALQLVFGLLAWL